MEKITRQLQRLCSSGGRNWKHDGNRVEIPIGEGDRHQTITCERQHDDYVLTSVVLGTARVMRNATKWRELAKLVWHRNAENQIVTFAFDRRDRLVGQVRHPAAHLDYKELELYVDELARECDRFEYLLTGQDVY